MQIVDLQIMSRRGRQKYDKSGNTYFITTTVSGFIKVFSLNDKYYDVLIDNLKFYLGKHKALLIAYVLMPHHIHLILHMPVGESISDFMRDFKKFTSKIIKENLQADGFKSTVAKLVEISRIGKFKLWMDRFDDVILISDKVMEIKINYIHENPVKAGLVKKMIDWKYSSARNYYLNDNSVIEVYKL